MPRKSRDSDSGRKTVRHVSSTKIAKQKRCGPTSDQQCSSQDSQSKQKDCGPCPGGRSSSESNRVKGKKSAMIASSPRGSQIMSNDPDSFFDDDYGPPSRIQVSAAKSGRFRGPHQYAPKPYTFRIPLSFSRELTKGIVKSPPFYLQLDHTLAVVWTLFSKEEVDMPLGIVQLQWALNFLKGVHNAKGEHPKDIEVCIQAIEDQLIEQYASMIEEVNIPEKGGRNYMCSGYECIYKKKKYDEPEGSRVSMSTKRTNSMTTNKTNQSQYMINQSVPFSVNYAEMIKHNPKGIEQLFRAKEVISVLDEAERLTAMTSTQGIVDSKSRDFLKTIRKEQIDKIQAELKTLHLIEDFISNPERGGYVFENRSVNHLVAQKVSPPGSTSGCHKRSRIPKKST